MNVEFRESFKKAYKKMPIEIQNGFKKKLDLMQNNIWHPSLRIKKMRSHDTIWEGSINMQYRFTFEFIIDGVLFRNIGNHDEALGNP